MKPTSAQLDAIFLALSHDVRRHILALLSQRGDELSSGYLAARFSHSWPTTTRHLKVLEDAGLVEVRREGRASNYRLVREHLAPWVMAWLRHLERPTPDMKWGSSGPKTTRELAAKERQTKDEHTEDFPRHRRSRQHRGGSRVLRKAP